MKLKFDVTESDVDEAKAAGSFEKPKPGLYRFSLAEVNLGFTKGDDGKPDKGKPYIEVVFKCDDSRYKGAQVWAYFVQPGHPKYDKGAAQKWDQLLLALGITSEKKRKGEIDTDKQMVGKFVTVRVRGGKDQSGEYRAEYGSVFPDGHGGTSGASGDGSTLLSDDEEMGSDADETMEEEGSDSTEERRAELLAASVPDLKAIAKEYELSISGMKKSEVVEALLEYEASMEESDDGEIIEDDEIMDDGDEAPKRILSRAELQGMDAEMLRSLAKDFDLTIKGMKKSEVVDAILSAQGAEEDDEMPF